MDSWAIVRPMKPRVQLFICTLMQLQVRVWSQSKEYIPPQVFRAGDYKHSLEVRWDGGVWAVGRNDFGQLGDGSVAHRQTPKKVFINALEAKAGEWHSVFLRNDGFVYACGRNEYGQLGDGTKKQRSFPMFVGRDYQAIAAGGFHSIALGSDGIPRAMGQNNHGQLGDGTFVPAKRPTPVLLDNVVAVAAGSDHSVYLRNDGTAWASGRNHYGQLGDRTTLSSREPKKIMDGVTAINAKFHFSLFVLANASLIAAGQFDGGQERNRTDWNPIQMFTETEVQTLTIPI